MRRRRPRCAAPSRRFWREVPEPYRTTVVLRDIEGFSYEEVAEILNTQLGTVKSRLMRGRAHLKQKLIPLMASRSAHTDTSKAQTRRNGARAMKILLCTEVEDQFSSYMDGSLSGAAMVEIQEHMRHCRGCTGSFASWQATLQSLACLGQAKAPPMLGLRLRVAISRERSRTWSGRLELLRLRWQNTLGPFAVRASAGFATAVLMGGHARASRWHVCQSGAGGGSVRTGDSGDPSAFSVCVPAGWVFAVADNQRVGRGAGVCGREGPRV